MKITGFITSLFVVIMSIFMIGTAQAGNPLWTFTPLTATTLTIPTNQTATIQYILTNQSAKTHKLSMQAIPGITQISSGLGICGNPAILTSKASCTLSLQVNGSLLTQAISNGPIICEQGSSLQCYRPTASDNLHITPATPMSDATISVTGSPLTLSANGSSGTLTITNTSLEETANNITSNFTGTALDGNVTEIGNTCASVAPLASCTLSYLPGGTVVSLTSFTIQGSNTNVLTAAIQIDSSASLTSISPAAGTASGGTGVTLTGSGLTGTSDITFGGIAATSIQVVNSTTVTAVTPAHAVGSVDVVITTPSGSATLNNAYTYLSTAIGQSAFGGIIACLNGGLNNLIVATADNSVGTPWGGAGTLTSAASTTDGAANTAAIVNCLTDSTGGGCPGNIPVNTYAAGICSSYEVDSQGNTPCVPGNTCYDDWFLPAGNNLSASGQLNCLYSNQIVLGGFTSAPYWSSTEDSNPNFAWLQNFSNGVQSLVSKNNSESVRCVRAFTP